MSCIFCILEEHALDHTWRFLLELVGLFERLLETEMVAELRNEAVSLVLIGGICERRATVINKVDLRKGPQGIFILNGCCSFLGCRVRLHTSHQRAPFGTEFVRANVTVRHFA